MRRRKTRQPEGRAGAALLLLSLLVPICLPASSAASDPVTVPTFECIGIYWDPVEGGANVPCLVEYRESQPPFGWGPWNDAQDLWYDNRTTGSQYPAHPDHQTEYRGSIVGLKPETIYQVRLSLGDPSIRVETCVDTTWSETFPVEGTVTLRPSYSNTYVINSGGDEEAGTFVLYRANTMTGSTVIDVPNQYLTYGIDVRASNVIIRGLTVKGGEHGIYVREGVRNVVIEECDISDWSFPDPDAPNWADGLSAGIYAGRFGGEPADVERLIIQRNTIHDPKWGSNSWYEKREGGVDCTGESHPDGPQGITLINVAGNNVIRYNDIYSHNGNYFDDIIGGGSNFSYYGCPGRDTDIYQNRLSQCWDDGIEAEGGGMNVRIWENYIDSTYVKIACRSTSIGPFYAFRNISATSLLCPLGIANICGLVSNRGPFLKTGNLLDHPDVDGDWGDGKVYIFHNTILQPDPVGTETIDHGCSSAIRGSRTRNHMTRNNIFQVPSQKYWWETFQGCTDTSNDFDYDLINGDLDPGYVYSGAEPNGWHQHGSPNYEPTYGQDNYDPISGADVWGQFWIVPGSVGYDLGVLLPNFNDDFTGNGPEPGVQDYLAPLMEIGVDAELPGGPRGIVEQPSLDGSSDGPAAELSATSGLGGVSSNPFNPSTRIHFTVGREGIDASGTVRVLLDVLDVTGRRVALLKDEKLSPGDYSVLWEGRQANGQPAGSGIYFNRLRIGDQTFHGKIVLAK